MKQHNPEEKESVKVKDQVHPCSSAAELPEANHLM
jgi:hypothetical protein